MLKPKKDFTCKLLDKDGTVLGKFFATAVSDPTFSAGFEGGGVASASQALTVFTEFEFDYKQYAQRVYVEELHATYILTNYTISIRRKLGAGRKFMKVYILELN